MVEGCAYVPPPDVEQAAGSVAGRAADDAIKEIILTFQPQLKAAAGEGTVIDIQVSVGIVQIRFIRVADDPYRQRAGCVDHFFRDIGAKPAEDLFAFAFLL